MKAVPEGVQAPRLSELAADSNEPAIASEVSSSSSYEPDGLDESRAKVAAWFAMRAACISGRCSIAQRQIATSGSLSVRPSGVSEYSTCGGITSITVRCTSPSRSMLRRVCVSIFWEMPSIVRLSAPCRTGQSNRAYTTRQVHLSAMRSSAWRDSQFWSSTLGCAVSEGSIRSVSISARRHFQVSTCKSVPPR